MLYGLFEYIIGSCSDDYNKIKQKYLKQKSFCKFMEECLFCKIAKGEIPCSKVYENDNVLAFLDIAPVNKGHVLVIPKNHYENVLDVDEDILKEVISVVQKVAIGVKKGVNADGIVISQNNGKIAGQVIMHLHFHVIPRFKEDELGKWPQGKYKDGEMDEYSERISSFLS